MALELSDLTAFTAVARAGGFREAARAGGGSASSFSEAVTRLEARLGVRLLNRTTRSVAMTERSRRMPSSNRPEPCSGCGRRAAS